MRCRTRLPHRWSHRSHETTSRSQRSISAPADRLRIGDHGCEQPRFVDGRVPTMAAPAHGRPSASSRCVRMIADRDAVGLVHRDADAGRRGALLLGAGGAQLLQDSSYAQRLAHGAFVVLAGGMSRLEIGRATSAANVLNIDRPHPIHSRSCRQIRRMQPICLKPPGVIADNIIGFARALRAAGMPVGPGATIDALKALQVVGLEQPRRTCSPRWKACSSSGTSTRRSSRRRSRSSFARCRTGTNWSTPCRCRASRSRSRRRRPRAACRRRWRSATWCTSARATRRRCTCRSPTRRCCRRRISRR